MAKRTGGEARRCVEENILGGHGSRRLWNAVIAPRPRRRLLRRSVAGAGAALNHRRDHRRESRVQRRRLGRLHRHRHPLAAGGGRALQVRAADEQSLPPPPGEVPFVPLRRNWRRFLLLPRLCALVAAAFGVPARQEKARDASSVLRRLRLRRGRRVFCCVARPAPFVAFQLVLVKAVSSRLPGFGSRSGIHKIVVLRLASAARSNGRSRRLAQEPRSRGVEVGACKARLSTAT